MPDKPVQQPPAAEAPRRASDELLPLNPGEGQGQRLSDADRSVMESRSELEAAKAKADEDYRKAQMEIRGRQRQLAEGELSKQREAAMEAVDEQSRQNDAIFQKFPGTAQMVHPAYLEMEAARNRAVADALQSDETVPGGIYRVDGKLVDCDGNPLE